SRVAMPEGDRFGAAYHEAGHAVVAWALGLAVRSLAINHNDPTAGATDIASAEYLSIVDRLAVCLAGIEAQDLFGFPTHGHAGVSDYAKVLEIIGEDISEEQSQELRDAGHGRARELMVAHESKVVCLAERLAENGRIDAEEFMSLMEAR